MQLVVHSYTLTNLGPFYARNVSVTIDWPLRLAKGRDHWLLYPLEDPLIKHNDEIRSVILANFLLAETSIG